jgi:hypothetical protein
MASNRYTLPILITALFLTAPASLWAQSSGYYMELRFVQRLTWVGDEYAMRYEVIIEKEEDGKYNRVQQEFTTAFFIEVSLSPGKYRYQVIPYDFLDLPVPVTEWMDFEVQRGIRREELDNYVPGEHEIILVNPSEPENRSIVNITSPKPPDPVEPEIKKEIIVQSPEPKTVIVHNIPFDIYLGLAWIPYLPIYGKNESFGEKPSPYGAGLRLAIISVKQPLCNFGVESSSSWFLSSGDQPVHSLSFDLNFVLCFSNDKVSFNYKAGAGVSLRSGESPISDSGLYAFHVNIGLSFFWLPLKHLYLEPGIDYVHSFADSGFIRPSIGLGYKF